MHVMEPLSHYEIIPRLKSSDPKAWHQQLHDRMWTHVDEDTRVIVFGRINNWRRWIVLYGTVRKQSLSALSTCLDSHPRPPSMMCIVWGAAQPPPDEASVACAHTLVEQIVEIDYRILSSEYTPPHSRLQQRGAWPPTRVVEP